MLRSHCCINMMSCQLVTVMWTSLSGCTHHQLALQQLLLGAPSLTVMLCMQTRSMRVDVETASPLSLGQTVCDVWSSTGRPPNVNVALVWSKPSRLHELP